MATKWRELVQRYAQQARELSNAIAVLGQATELEPESCRDYVAAIRGKLALCIAAANEIDRYLEAEDRSTDTGA
jgi:hypothetical protein